MSDRFLLDTNVVSHISMIAAHAVAVNATLVSRDKALAQVPVECLRLEIW